MQISQRWTIDFSSNLATDVRREAPSALVVPQFPVPRGMPAEAAALLPLGNYNNRLLDSLNPRPEWSRIPDIATFFAADPFIRIDRFALALKARGVTRVCNLPTCSQFGSEYAQLVDDAKLGFEREMGRLAEMAAAGFELYPAVATFGGAVEALKLDPAGLIALRSPAVMRDEIGEDAALKALCRQIRQKLGVSSQVLLFALTGERGGQAVDHVDGTIRYAT